MGLCDVLGSVWCHQERWIIWEGYVAEKPIEAHCAPQGDPAAPFLLNCWMTAGDKIVLRRLQKEGWSARGVKEEGKNTGLRITVRRRVQLIEEREAKAKEKEER